MAVLRRVARMFRQCLINALAAEVGTRLHLSGYPTYQELKVLLEGSKGIQVPFATRTIVVPEVKLFSTKIIKCTGPGRMGLKVMFRVQEVPTGRMVWEQFSVPAGNAQCAMS